MLASKNSSIHRFGTTHLAWQYGLDLQLRSMLIQKSSLLMKCWLSVTLRSNRSVTRRLSHFAEMAKPFCLSAMVLEMSPPFVVKFFGWRRARRVRSADLLTWSATISVLVTTQFIRPMRQQANDGVMKSSRLRRSKYSITTNSQQTLFIPVVK